MAEAAPENEVYRRIKLLGEGSFGKAFLVECVADGSLCVVKQMDMKKMTEEEKTETLKESKILEALIHPNIVRFREVYTTKKGKLCIVMDYADGGDLSSRIKEAPAYMPESTILNYFTQICLAVKHIHDRKIIHRDLKGQNIFLTKSNIVKLGDFGIARVLNSTKDKAKTVVGTPYYLSPEIIESKPYSFKSDIWSLGVVLYELCALKPPFVSDSLSFLALKIVRGQYQPIPNHYTKDMKNLVYSLLVVDPAKRPSIKQILAQPILQNRIKNFLSESIHMDEFSHTILHNQNIFDGNGMKPVPAASKKVEDRTPPAGAYKKPPTKATPPVAPPKNMAAPKPVVQPRPVPRDLASNGNDPKKAAQKRTSDSKERAQPQIPDKQKEIEKLKNDMARVNQLIQDKLAPKKPTLNELLGAGGSPEDQKKRVSDAGKGAKPPQAQPAAAPKDASERDEKRQKMIEDMRKRKAEAAAGKGGKAEPAFELCEGFKRREVEEAEEAKYAAKMKNKKEIAVEIYVPQKKGPQTLEQLKSMEEPEIESYSPEFGETTKSVPVDADDEEEKLENPENDVAMLELQENEDMTYVSMIVNDMKEVLKLGENPDKETEETTNESEIMPLVVNNEDILGALDRDDDLDDTKESPRHRQKAPIPIPEEIKGEHPDQPEPIEVFSDYHKLESLKMYLEEGLGAEEFVNAYKLIKEEFTKNTDLDEVEKQFKGPEVYKKLFPKMSAERVAKYMPLVYNFIIMEEMTEAAQNSPKK